MPTEAQGERGRGAPRRGQGLFAGGGEMRKVVKRLAGLLRRVYFRLARPVLNRAREERQHEQHEFRELHRQMRQELAAVCAAVRAEADQLARGRQELLDQVRADRNALREELGRINQGFVEYHAVLTQKVADELTKMNRKLEPPARAA